VASTSAWYALIVLSLVTLFALVDRQILVLLSEPIRKQLALSDFQLGLLQGTAVTLFAALAAYPLSWLADRIDRRRVMAACVITWSVGCAACGLAQTYPQLLMASALVGAAEAGLVPITYALIPALFAPRQLQVANSTFALATGIGGSATIALCGMLVANVEAVRPLLPDALSTLEGWRLSFFAAALPGPLMAALVLTITRRGARPLQPPVAAATTTPAAVARRLIPHVRQHLRTFVHFSGGVGLSFFGFGAVNGWIANMLIRQFEQTPMQVGNGLGLAGTVGLALGFLISAFGLKSLTARLGLRLQLRQQLRRDGEQIATCQCGDLPNVAKARTHHLCRDAMLLVVVVNVANALHPWVVHTGTCRLIPFRSRGLFVPIVNTPDKRGNEFHPRLRTRQGLRKRKQQSEVGVNAFAL